MATTNSRQTSRHKKSRSHHHEKKHQRKKSNLKETDHESKHVNKYKTLAQLAKLVHNGKLKIPCSLVEYVDDHASLIDQVFTILTVEDIEGMLPDILKGLKLKKIKHLCYLQLSKMSSDDLRRILIEDSSSVPENIEGETPSLDSVVTGDTMEADSAGNVGGAYEEDHIEVNVSCTDISPYNSTEDRYGERTVDKVPCDIAMPTVSGTTVGLITSCELSLPVNVIEEKEKQWHVDIPEEARLLEMRFRERLLEAQVKRLSSKREKVNDSMAHHDSDGNKSADNNGNESSGSIKSDDRDGNEFGDRDGNESGDRDGNESDDRDGNESDRSDINNDAEPGELAELDLRQRALESLLNKRKEKLKAIILK